MIRRTVIISALFLILVATTSLYVQYDERVDASFSDADKTEGYVEQALVKGSPSMIRDPSFVPIIYCFAPPYNADKGITGKPGPKGYVRGGNNQCYVTALLNSNIEQYLDLNPNGFRDPAVLPGPGTGMSRQEFGEWMTGFIDRCIDRKNSDGDPTNDIDLSDSVAPHSTPGGQISPEAQSLIDCKNEFIVNVMNIFGFPPTPPPHGGPPPPGCGQPCGLLGPPLVSPPDLEEYTNIFVWHPGQGGIVFVGQNNWCEELRDALNNGDTGILSLLDAGGVGAMNHAVTIVGVDCLANPPRIIVLDTDGMGNPISLDAVQNPDGSITITNSDAVGINPGATVVSVTVVG